LTTERNGVYAYREYSEIHEDSEKVSVETEGEDGNVTERREWNKGARRLSLRQ